MRIEGPIWPLIILGFVIGGLIVWDPGVAIGAPFGAYICAILAAACVFLTMPKLKGTRTIIVVIFSGWIVGASIGGAIGSALVRNVAVSGWNTGHMHLHLPLISAPTTAYIGGLLGGILSLLGARLGGAKFLD